MRDGTGKLPTPDSHVDNEYGTKTMIYNWKKDRKRVGGERNTTGERKEEP